MYGICFVYKLIPLAANSNYYKDTVVFNLFCYPVKSQLLRMKYVFEHKDLQMLVPN